MLTKILFTVLVAAGVITAARLRSRQIRQRPLPARADSAAMPSWAPRAFGLVFALLVLAGAGVYFYLDWHDDHRIINIRVVNTRNGDTATYRAYKGDISGRSFETVEGWRVTPSEAERVEMVEE